MRIRHTPIDGLRIIEWDCHQDPRGSFCRTFCDTAFHEAGIRFQVAQANISVNPTKHTLRGLHHQAAPHAEAKLVSCLNGRVFDVAVDLRARSPTYRQWFGLELGATPGTSLFLCEGLAHGFLTLEPDCQVQYLMGAPFVPGAARGIRWDDPSLGVDWPAAPELISARDAGFPLLDTAT